MTALRDFDEARGARHFPQCAVWTSDEPCSLNCVVMAALAQVVPKYERLCARKGGCKTVALNLFWPVVEAWLDEPPARFDRVMVTLWVFVHKFAEHLLSGWEENGRQSIAAPAFAPVAAAYRAMEAAA